MNIYCTNCKKVIIPPVWQCKNLHLFCSSCLESRCSICEESLVFPVRSQSVEEVIKNSEELSCMYIDEGCDFIGRFIDLSHHQITCEYSDIPNSCLFSGCCMKFRKKLMIDHISNHHKAGNITKIDNGKFQVEVFKQIDRDEDWKTFLWKPFLYKRDLDDEERVYLVQIRCEDWVMSAYVFSLTHESEPVRYLLEVPKGKNCEENPNKYVLISHTVSYKQNSPVFALPISYLLDKYSYTQTRSDIKALLLQFQLPNKDFYNFN
jgi:hypothetical protein